jgi:hypothetical protein
VEDLPPRLIVPRRRPRQAVADPAAAAAAAEEVYHCIKEEMVNKQCFFILTAKDKNIRLLTVI